jgi:predicted nucleic acid-binding Zn ribbon protein
VSAEPPADGASGSGASGSGASGSGAGGDLQPPAEPAGPQLARAALDAARAAGRTPTTRKRRDGESGGERRRRGYTGPGADARDPQPFGRLIRRLVEDRGWEKSTAEATVLGSWDRLVGPEIAARCRPLSLREGELTLQAESTAWATQLRMLTGKLLNRIRAELGPDVVTKIRVHGPATPSWKKGPRSVPGRGPRDTYG